MRKKISDVAVLAAIDDGARLCRILARTSIASHGALAKRLKRLSAEGMVCTDETRGRYRLWHLTARGHGRLRASAG